MIQEIWILERDAGRCIFNSVYTKSMIDPDLITTVLNVLYHISIELSGKGIETVDMAGLRWYFVTEEDLIFISCCDRNDKASVIREKTIIIKNEFFDKFPDLKKVGFFKEWDGNISTYEDFQKNLSELFSDWSKAEEVTDHASILDLLEVHQQIFKLLKSDELAPKNNRSKAYLTKNVKDVLNKYPFLKEKCHFKNYRLEVMDKIDIRKDHVEDINMRGMLEELCSIYVAALKNINGPDKFYKFFREIIVPYIKKDWQRINDLDLLRGFYECFF